MSRKSKRVLMAEVVQSDKVKDNSETKKKRVRAILDCTRKNTVSSKKYFSVSVVAFHTDQYDFG